METGPEHSIVKRSHTNRPGRLLAALETGAMVRLRSKGAWAKRAKVLRPSGHPSSHDVTAEEGRQLRRNRRHLLLTSEDFSPDLPDSGQDVAPSATAHEVPVALPGYMPTAPIPGTTATQAPRRSQRQRKAPRRLAYNENFVQVP
ncbi:hypothetical protein MRX96_036238 [Rhipicephalus microplus]